MKKIKIRRCKKAVYLVHLPAPVSFFTETNFSSPSNTRKPELFMFFASFTVRRYLFPQHISEYPVYRHYPQQIDSIAAKIAVEPFPKRIFPFQKQRIGKTVFKLTVYIEQNGMTVGKESRIIPRDVRESGKVGVNWSRWRSKISFFTPIANSARRSPSGY